MDAEYGGHLIERQHALPPQTAAAVFETVPRAKSPDDEGAELIPYARSETSGVQDPGDLGISMVFQKAIDLGDHCRIRPPQLIGRFRPWQTNRMRGSATEPDLGDDLVCLQQGHVLQQQANHAL